jgi:uncharacterized protein YhbP (UPF0306 family)
MARYAFARIFAVDAAGTALDRAGVSEERLRRSVLPVLESTLLCSIASVTPEGRAHIHTAYFSYSEALELYFLSHPASLHGRNVIGNPSVAMTVFSSAQRWTDPGQGVQLFGNCEQTAGASADEAERSYRTRFPVYDRWKAALGEDDPGRQYRFYRFDVTAVKVLDEKNLGDGVFVRADVLRP